MAIEVFSECDKTNTSGQQFDGKYLWRTGEITIDQQGEIIIDLNCKSLKNKQELSFRPRKKIKELSLTGLGECFELEKLDIFCLEGCCLKQPVNLPKSQNLTCIRLVGCGLEQLPVSVHQCPNVKILNLDGNERLGDQAASLEGLINLEELYMKKCGLRETPERLEECAALRRLNLSDNDRLGDQAVSLEGLINLEVLNLVKCGLKETPERLEKCAALRTLNLSDNERLGDQAVSLEGLINLEVLWLMKCGLKETPERLEECVALRALWLNGPPNVGIHLAKLRLKLPKLQELWYNDVIYRRRGTGFVSFRGDVLTESSFDMSVPFEETTSDDHGGGLSSDLVVQPQYPSSITEKIYTFQEMTPLIEKWVDCFVSEACEPGRAEKLLFGDSFRLIEARRVSDGNKLSYAYTYHASINDHLTDNIRKSMTSDVKKQAYATLFVGNESQQVDQAILNLARESCRKNASTARPAWLLPILVRCCKSIGRISCGRVQGTCFLVTSNVIITCYHVLLDFNKERTSSNDPNIEVPVKVTFDFSGQVSTEMEVDMTDPRIYSSSLDYVFLPLHQSFGDGVGLGHLVRNHAVTDNVVTIIGYPERVSMTEETCVVVRNDEKEALLKERIRTADRAAAEPNLHTYRHRIMSGEYDERLPYDTSLFRGSSGSPVFDMNGHLVALHCQGYPLEVEGREYSVMEFGVHFSSICEDLRRRFPRDLGKLFPQHDEPFDMDTDEMNL